MPDILPSTPRKLRIAIAGATGRVGAALTTLLASDPVDIVALTRRPEEARLPAGASVAAVDFDQPQTLRDALRGADRLFLAQGSSLQQVANEIALIDAAVATGVGHIVKLSAMSSATRLYPGAWHMEIEAHLARQWIASTVLRPSGFNELLKRFAKQISDDFWTSAAGNGRVNFIDTRDIAKVARLALLDEVGPELQRAYHLTGPRQWTMAQVADELSRLLGRRVVHNHRAPEQQRAALLAGGVPPFTVDLLLGLDQMFRELVIAETTSTVRELTGEAPRDLSDWLAENVTLFRKE